MLVEYNSEPSPHKFDSSRHSESKNDCWVATPFNDRATITPTSEQIDEYLLQDKETENCAEFKPNFGKLETILNSLLLILLTIGTAAIALILSPVFIVSSVKTFSRKIAEKITNKNG